jgi:hypothetical protein
MAVDSRWKHHRSATDPWIIRAIALIVGLSTRHAINGLALNTSGQNQSEDRILSSST